MGSADLMKQATQKEEKRGSFESENLGCGLNSPYVPTWGAAKLGEKASAEYHYLIANKAKLQEGNGLDFT